MNEIRIAIFGYSPTVEQLYLPCLKTIDDVRVTAFIESDLHARNSIGSKFGVQYVHAEFEDFDLFDAAVVTGFSPGHAAVCTKLLKNHKAVLVESPMALSARESAEIVSASRQANTLLAVSQMQRCLWTTRFCYTLIKSGQLGRVRRFDFRKGHIFDAPISSPSFFRRETVGGGVLVVEGYSVIDVLAHWLGDFAKVQYWDDSAGGVEANCLLEISLESGAHGLVELSRTRELRNTAIIICDGGTIEVGLHTNDLKLTLADQPFVFAGEIEMQGKEAQDDLGLMRLQLEDFVSAVKTHRRTDIDEIAVIRLVEACYESRGTLDPEWMRYQTWPSIGNHG